MKKTDAKNASSDPVISNASKPADKLPLFFTSPAVLDSERHAKAGIRQDQGMEFAAATNAVPLNITELAEAAKFYPIVLTMEEPLVPLAILGFEQKNYFVNAKGKWQKKAYIPAYVRKYPFVFVEDPKSDKLTLCVDEGSSHFVTPARGESVSLLYDKNGMPTEFARNALAFCLAVQQDYHLSRQFCDALQEAGILSANKVDATLNEGRTFSLSGFQQVDAAKFRALPDDKIAELRKKEWLAPIYYMLLSNTNWKNLLEMAGSESEK